MSAGHLNWRAEAFGDAQLAHHHWDDAGVRVLYERVGVAITVRRYPDTARTTWSVELASRSAGPDRALEHEHVHRLAHGHATPARLIAVLGRCAAIAERLIELRVAGYQLVNSRSGWAIRHPRTGSRTFTATRPLHARRLAAALRRLEAIPDNPQPPAGRELRDQILGELAAAVATRAADHLPRLALALNPGLPARPAVHAAAHAQALLDSGAADTLAALHDAVAAVYEQPSCSSPSASARSRPARG